MDPTPPLFSESDPRGDILSAMTHAHAARIRLALHPQDSVLAELARELDDAQKRLEARLRTYPPHRRSAP